MSEFAQPIEFSEQDRFWMQQALIEAEQALLYEEVPVGAVIVHENQIIGRGYNCPIRTSDPTAHAEIQAIRNACNRLENYRLPENSVLYVTLEPCTQCVGALIHARIAKVIFAAKEPRAGSLVSARQLLKQGFYNHYFDYWGGCLEAESAKMLKDFFRNRRLTAKSNCIGNKNDEI